MGISRQRKSKQRNKCRKNNNRFKKLKIIEKEKWNKTKNSIELQKPNAEAEVYNNKKCDRLIKKREEKEAQKLN